MKKIINILENAIYLIELKMKVLSSSLNFFLIEKTIVDIMHSDPDNVNINTLKHQVPQEYLYKLEYIEKLQGWCQKFPNEPQIQLALKYLTDIELVLKEKRNRSIKITIKMYQQCNQLKNTYEMLLKKFKTYDKNTYIEESELSIIEELIDEEIIDEDLIALFSYIGKNNSIIRIKQEKGKYLFDELGDAIDNELFEAMDCDREQNLGDAQILFTRIKNVIDSDTMLYAAVGNMQLVEEIKNYFTMIFELEYKITDEIVEEADIFKEELESIDDSDVFMVAITLLIVDAIEKNKGDIITTILECYKNSKYSKQMDSLENQLLEVKRNRLKQIIDEYYIEEEYIKFNSAYEDIPESELVKFVSLETIQSMKIMKLIYTHYETKDTMTLEQLDTLISNLELQMVIYKQIQSEFDKQSEEFVADGLNIDDVLNYVVFLNTDRIRENIEEIIREQDVNLSLFASAIYKLLMIQQNDLYSRDTCKPIISSNGKPNEYEIREERAGNIRICFKAISSYNGKFVYEVLGFAFGACGDRRKTDNLKKSIKEYVSYYPDYQRLESIFSENNEAEIEHVINDSLDFYNNLINVRKKKVKE